MKKFIILMTLAFGCIGLHASSALATKQNEVQNKIDTSPEFTRLVHIQNAMRNLSTDYPSYEKHINTLHSFIKFDEPALKTYNDYYEPMIRIAQIQKKAATSPEFKRFLTLANKAQGLTPVAERLTPAERLKMIHEEAIKGYTEAELKNINDELERDIEEKEDMQNSEVHGLSDTEDEDYDE